MIEFYYAIKTQAQSGCDYFGAWAHPPRFSGLVTATSKAEAKALIEDEYGRVFPLRVLKKDLADQPFLLRIDELKADDYRRKWFETVACKCCSVGFRRIDKFNDPLSNDTGQDYCSAKCREDDRDQAISEMRLAQEGISPPVIYRIQQVSTGRCYIGQTTQAFTLRWWQHVAHPTETKFHQAFKASDGLTDWTFAVVEVVGKAPDGVSASNHITHRERHWIDFYDSVKNGFNTVLPSAVNPQQTLELDPLF